MSSRNVCLIVVCLLFAVSALAQTAAPAQSGSVKVKTTTAPYTDPTSGKDMYNAYCASCHGTDLKGNGPAAGAFKATPTDLTKLAAKNNGEFPALAVSNIILGDKTLAAHGTKDMPVWGPVFSSLSKRDQGQVMLRVHNLTEYIKQMQGK